VQVAAEGQPASLADGFAAVRSFVSESEQRFSRFNPESELSALNQSAGGWFKASQDLVDMLQDAAELHQLTDGLFDPSILPALIHSGYDRCMDEIRLGGPLPAGAFKLWARPNFREVMIDAQTNAIRLPDGMQLDCRAGC
jgi:thiamine biosynthesis lipoprotein